ncbi:hypothetical protein GS966_25670 [Rhodococcus hoagii]|nr:hypothetical protein [Prescottella equi]NKS61663.1 hypothetical protein [Prescottella equi]NKZ93232.1 hypothetical protein [Prescottella equi]NKZ93292.1 hypothetical protein [Prescottella equi]
MDLSSIATENVTITATIAAAANETNTVNLEAHDPERPDVPLWEMELVAAQFDPMNWNTTIATRVLADHGYSIEGEWWDSTADTGYNSQSVHVLDNR